MQKGNLSLIIPNPHGRDIGPKLLGKILRQAGIEVLHQPGLVIARIRPSKESIEGLSEEPFPAPFFAAWIDREQLEPEPDRRLEMESWIHPQCPRRHRA